MKEYSTEAFAIHTEPLIRREEMYTDMLSEDKRSIFTKLFFLPLEIQTIYQK